MPKTTKYYQVGMDNHNVQGGPYGGFFKEFNPLTPMGDRRSNIMERDREGA